MIEFKHKPASVDPLLEDKLRSKAPGILRWMINGALDWQSEGLIMPKSVRLATDDYLAGQDTFGNWLNECCESGPALRKSGGKLREVLGSVRQEQRRRSRQRQRLRGEAQEAPLRSQEGVGRAIFSRFTAQSRQ